MILIKHLIINKKSLIPILHDNANPWLYLVLQLSFKLITINDNTVTAFFEIVYQNYVSLR